MKHHKSNTMHLYIEYISKFVSFETLVNIPAPDTIFMEDAMKNKAGASSIVNVLSKSACIEGFFQRGCQKRSSTSLIYDR